MNKWYPTAQLVGLPGLPNTIRSINRLASRDNWQARPRSGRGGGNEYHIDALPPVTQSHLRQQQLRESSDPTGQADGSKFQLVEATHKTINERNKSESMRSLSGLSETEEQRVNARLAIYKAWNTFLKLSPLNKVDAQYRFCEQYNAGAVPIEDAIARSLYPSISRGTLARWESDLKKSGAASLAGRYGNRKGKNKIQTQPEIESYLQGVLVTYPHIAARTLHEGMVARFHERNDLDLPGSRSVERWLNKWKKDNAQVFTSIANPDEWKNKYMVAHGSLSENVQRLNQVWEFDATPADLLLSDGRHSLSGVIDVYSRRLKLLVTKTSKAVSVAALIRKSLIDWGVPEIAKTDNGKEYVGHHITRVFTSLNIEQVLCPPFQPWHKPHIERAFRTFSHDLVELLPGYIGHNVADRKELEARKSFAERLYQKNEAIEIKMTAEDLQEFCDRWCESVYHHRKHGGIHTTPFEMVSNWQGKVQRIKDERALDLLLVDAPDNHGRRTVTKKGIRIKWPHEANAHHYIAPELGNYVKQQVHVAYDPAGDMGRIYVFGQDGFICVAECPELTGVDRQEYAAIAKQQQKVRVQEQRRQLKEAAKNANAGNLSQEILAHYENQTNNVSLFPRQGEDHSSDGLEQAIDAIAFADSIDKPREGKPVSNETIMRVAHMMEKESAPEETPDDRFKKAIAILDGKLQATDADLDWLRVYQISSEFRGRYMAWKSLGEGADRSDLEDDPWLNQQMG